MAVRAVVTAPLIALLVTSGQEPVPPAVRYEQHVFAGGAAPPAGTLENPFKGDRRDAAGGGKVFSPVNFDGCHAPGAPRGVGRAHPRNPVTVKNPMPASCCKKKKKPHDDD